MAQCLAINSNNDIYRGSNGNIVLLSGQSAVQTACATATKAQLGEMVYATTTGMPTFQAVWIGTPNINIYLNYLRQTILNVLGVVSIQSLSASVATQTLSYTVNIESEYGQEFTLNG